MIRIVEGHEKIFMYKPPGEHRGSHLMATLFTKKEEGSCKCTIIMLILSSYIKPRFFLYFCSKENGYGKLSTNKQFHRWGQSRDTIHATYCILCW